MTTIVYSPQKSVTLNLFQGPFFATLRFMRQEKLPCVYILASQRLGTIYIGVTSDLLARLHQHRSGNIPGFTKRYTVVHLVHYEMFGDMISAISREKQLKRWHRQWKINLIESENPDWHDLAPGLGFGPIAPRLGGNGS